MNSIEKFIDERKNDKDYVDDRDLDHKIRYVNNAMDSFRTIKDVLIANNNLLDASQWHKLELYAKEKELEFLMKKNRDEYQIRYSNLKSPKGFWLKTQAFFKKEALNLSYWLDNILLQIYRITSEHHTNFATILNFTATVIATQALLLCIFSKLLFSIDISILKNYNNLLIFILLLFLLIGIAIKLIDKNKTIAYFALPISIFYILFIIILFLTITNINDGYILICISLQIVAMIFVYLCYIYKEATAVRLFYDIVVLLSYLGLLYTLLFKPMLLNPFIGIFNINSLTEKRLEQELQNTPNHILISLAKDITGQNYIKYCYDCNSAETISIAKNIIRENQNRLLKQNDENHLQNMDYKNIKQAIKYDNLISDIFRTTSIIYSIILLLCIFSLQKTARKNSIIPS